jgi:hypothetical protein
MNRCLRKNRSTIVNLRSLDCKFRYLEYAFLLLLLLPIISACGSAGDTGGSVITNDSTNSSPISINQNVNVDQNSDVEFILAASDSDGDELSFFLVSSPLNGTLSGTAPAFLYTPNSDFSGTDSFQFKVTDGLNESNIATVSITIIDISPASPTHYNEIEPNQSSVAATLFTVEPRGGGRTYGSASGNISTVTDEDWFKFTAGSGNYDLDVTVMGSSSTNKVLFELYDSTQTFLSSMLVDPQTIAITTQTLRFGLSSSGTYYIVVKQSGSSPEPTSEGYSFLVDKV